MTSYQGGKKRVAKQIYQKMREIEEEIYQDKKLPYLEPFCGMCSVLNQVAMDGEREMTACDANPEIIIFWKAIKEGWQPPTQCDDELYQKLKKSEPSALRTFIGYTSTYASAYYKGKNRCKYNNRYIEEGSRAIAKVRDNVCLANFEDAKSYDQFKPKGMLIYCDPPYVGNKVGLKWFNKFDHEKFWQMMREWSKDNLVFVSEWKAPKDFVKVWGKKLPIVRHRKSGPLSVKEFEDCLYIHQSIFKLLSFPATNVEERS